MYLHIIESWIANTENSELITEKTKGNRDILLIFETNINKRFFDSQFKTDGFNYPYWVDHNKKGGGIMLLFREKYHLTIW